MYSILCVGDFVQGDLGRQYLELTRTLTPDPIQSVLSILHNWCIPHLAFQPCTRRELICLVKPGDRVYSTCMCRGMPQLGVALATPSKYCGR